MKYPSLRQMDFDIHLRYTPISAVYVRILKMLVSNERSRFVDPMTLKNYSRSNDSVINP